MARRPWIKLALLAGLSTCRSQNDGAIGEGAGADAAAAPAARGAATLGEQTRGPSRAVASALREIRETALPISAPPLVTQRLAFGKGMLGELSGDRLIVRDTTRPDELWRVDVVGPRALIALQNGALLAVGAEAVFRFEPGVKAAQVLRRVVFFPDSELLPERADAGFFWVAHRSSKNAYKYRLEQVDLPMLPTEADAELDGFDGRALAMQRDGVFVFSTESGLARLVPRGKRTPIERPKGSSGKPPWRVLPAERLDQVWVASADGEIELWQFTPFPKLVRSFRLAGTPHDLAATASFVAAVTIEQAANGPRRFWAVLYDREGKQTLRAELPSDPPGPGDDWLAGVTRNKNLALSESEGKLAVGGPTWLAVWDVRTGARLPWP